MCAGLTHATSSSSSPALASGGSFSSSNSPSSPLKPPFLRKLQGMLSDPRLGIHSRTSPIDTSWINPSRQIVGPINPSRQISRPIDSSRRIFLAPTDRSLIFNPSGVRLPPLIIRAIPVLEGMCICITFLQSSTRIFLITVGSSVHGQICANTLKTPVLDLH